MSYNIHYRKTINHQNLICDITFDVLIDYCILLSDFKHTVISDLCSYY